MTFLSFGALFMLCFLLFGAAFIIAAGLFLAVHEGLSFIGLNIPKTDWNALWMWLIAMAVMCAFISRFLGHVKQAFEEIKTKAGEKMFVIFTPLVIASSIFSVTWGIINLPPSTEIGIFLLIWLGSVVAVVRLSDADKKILFKTEERPKSKAIPIRLGSAPNKVSACAEAGSNLQQDSDVPVPVTLEKKHPQNLVRDRMMRETVLERVKNRLGDFKKRVEAFCDDDDSWFQDMKLKMDGLDAQLDEFFELRHKAVLKSVAGQNSYPDDRLLTDEQLSALDKYEELVESWHRQLDNAETEAEDGIDLARWSDDSS